MAFFDNVAFGCDGFTIDFFNILKNFRCSFEQFVSFYMDRIEFMEACILIRPCDL
jgi:hypothetical protein